MSAAPIPNTTFVNTPQEHQHEAYYTESERIIMATVLIFCIIVTFLGNSIMLWSIKFVPALQTVNNVFLASLCCANLINGLFTMPFIVSSMLSEQTPHMNIKKVWICTLTGYIDNGAMVGFIWTLTLLSVDRLILIQYPVWYKVQQNISKAARLVVIAWIFSLLLVTPPLFGASRYRYSPWTFSCGIDPGTGRPNDPPLEFHKNPSLVYFVIFCVVNSAVPIPVVLYSNLHILLILLKTRKMKKVNQATRYRRSALLLIVLTSYLLLTLSPVFISSYLHMVQMISPNTVKGTFFPSFNVLLASHMLFLGNGAITPVFFGLFNTSMRHKSTIVIKRQGSLLATSIVRRLTVKFPGLGSHHSSFNFSLRRMVSESVSGRRDNNNNNNVDCLKGERDETSAITRLVVPRKQLSNSWHGNGKSNGNHSHNRGGKATPSDRSLTDIGCSPFEYPSQRFVFPESSFNDGLEKELLKAWDEECKKCLAVESRV